MWIHHKDWKRRQTPLRGNHGGNDCLQGGQPGELVEIWFFVKEKNKRAEWGYEYRGTGLIIKEVPYEDDFMGILPDMKANQYLVLWRGRVQRLHGGHLHEKE